MSFIKMMCILFFQLQKEKLFLIAKNYKFLFGNNFQNLTKSFD